MFRLLIVLAVCNFCDFVNGQGVVCHIEDDKKCGDFPSTAGFCENAAFSECDWINGIDENGQPYVAFGCTRSREIHTPDPDLKVRRHKDIYVPPQDPAGFRGLAFAVVHCHEAYKCYCSVMDGHVIGGPCGKEVDGIDETEFDGNIMETFPDENSDECPDIVVLGKEAVLVSFVEK